MRIATSRSRGDSTATGIRSRTGMANAGATGLSNMDRDSGASLPASQMASGRTRCDFRAATPRPTRTALRASPSMDYTTLAVLGAYHGINPAMGWLFLAPALGRPSRFGARTGRMIVPDELG